MWIQGIRFRILYTYAVLQRKYPYASKELYVYSIGKLPL